MTTKYLPSTLLKADDAKGEVEAIVSAFDVVDAMNDRVVRGAFEGTIREHAALPNNRLPRLEASPVALVVLLSIRPRLGASESRLIP